MSVLKIKDQNNDWIQIPTIKGEKGDPFTYADFTPEQLESLKGKDGISPTVSVASDTSDDYRLSFTDETHTVTTPNLIPEAEKILSVYPHDTASGAVASFPDGADGIPLKSCIVQIEPVQEGSGDPSPDNVRPISGWTGCEVQRTGKNIWDEECRSGYYNDITGAFVPNSAYVANKNPISASPNTAYYGKEGSTYVDNLYCYDSDMNYLGMAVRNNDGTRVTRPNTAFVNFRTRQAYGATYNHDISINYPSTDHDYHTYTGQTYPIIFPAEAGTIYGGYIDPINGELVVDRAMVDLGTCDIKEYVDTGITNHLYSATLPDKLPYYDNNVVPVHLKCSALKPIEIARPISFLKILDPNTVAIRITYTDRVYIMSEIETVEAMKQSLDGVQLVYELAEPIHYPITSHEVKSLLGQNNLWANTGDTEVEYRASTKMYIDRKITEAVASALNS